MKKLIAVFLIMSGVLFTACGKKTDVKDIEETPAEVTSVIEEISKPVQNIAEEVSEIPSVEDEKISLLQLEKDYISVSYMDPESYIQYLDYSDEKVILSEEDAINFPALASTLEAELNERNRTYQSELDTLIEANRTEKEYGRDVEYTLNTKKYIKRADSVVLSILDSVSGYTGGAHGSYNVFGYNYDTQSGKILKFSDVVSDPVAFLKLADSKIQESFSDDFETPSSLDDFHEDYDTSIIWTVDYQGVKIYFNPYTLGSYALGRVETEIYFSEAPELFNSKYLNIPESYTAELIPHEDSLLDINNDGRNEAICVTSSGIIVDDNTISFDGTPEYCYYVSNNGKNYIFAFISYDEGYREISYIDVSTMKPDSGNETPGYLAVFNIHSKDEGERYEYSNSEAIFTDPNKVMLSTYIQYLGTMRGYGYYHMDDVSLVPDTGIYSIDMNNIMTANIDIDCEQVSPDGKVTGKAVIPERTRLVVRRGDGATFADLIEVPADADVDENDYYAFLNSDLKMEDAKTIYRVSGELGEYGSQAIINGQEEYLVFSNIMYSE